MSKLKISNAEVLSLSNASVYPFPKYTTQFINLINGNAQGTRPAVVGQMSDLIQEFQNDGGHTLPEWIEWYSQKQPEAVEKATNKVYETFLLMRDAMDKIDRQLIEEWVKDLVYNKTFCGLMIQGPILVQLSKIYGTGANWRFATPEEESQGIDGYIGGQAIQIKSDTYKLEQARGEIINAPIVYYTKLKDGYNIEFDAAKFDLDKMKSIIQS